MNIRIVRHTIDLKNAIEFYIGIIGLEKLGGFENHNGYDGIFIGKKDSNWHIEFTTSEENPIHIFDEDDILVFYPTSEQEYNRIINNLYSKKIKILKSKNPYWNENGILVKDFDNHNVIIRKQKIK